MMDDSNKQAPLFSQEFMDMVWELSVEIPPEIKYDKVASEKYMRKGIAAILRAAAILESPDSED